MTGSIYFPIYCNRPLYPRIPLYLTDLLLCFSAVPEAAEEGAEGAAAAAGPTGARDEEAATAGGSPQKLRGPARSPAHSQW